MKLVLILILVFGFVNSQVVNNVRLVGHTAYMINVLNEVISSVERRAWCNLKVPDLTDTINEIVLDRVYRGTVTYSNGFLATMQQVDIRQQGVNQIWSWNATEATGTVLVTGTIRMHDVTLGYDVAADLMDGYHRYTVTVTYPLVLFTFNIRKNVFTEEMTTEVTGSISTTANVGRIKFLPVDNTTDVLTTMFNVKLPEEGIRDWATVFEPIALNVVTHVVEFPNICYDCPVTAT